MLCYGGNFRVCRGVKTCEVFLCFVAIVRVRSIMLTSLFSVFYVTEDEPNFTDLQNYIDS